MDSEVERLCCTPDFIKQEDTEEDTVLVDVLNFENPQEAANKRNEVPHHNLECIAVKEESIDWYQEPQAGTSGVSSTFTLKREVDETSAKVHVWREETKRKLKKGSIAACNTNTIHQRSSGAFQWSTDLSSDTSVDAPISENPLEAPAAGEEVPARELEFIAVKEEPMDWLQEPQVIKSEVFSPLTPKREVDEVCAESSSGHTETEHKFRISSSGECNASNVHQRLAGASQGSADLLPSNVTDRSSSVEGTSGRRKCKFKCQFCDYMCSQRKLLMRHQVVKHKLGKLFKCDLCDFSSLYKQHYDVHQASQHGMGKHFYCEYCDYSSAFSSSLKVHQAGKHGMGALVKCEFCDYSTASNSYMKMHQASKHGKGKLFRCEFCDYSSAYSGLLRVHLANKHEYGKLLKCEFCDYSSINSAHFKQHQAIQHGKGKIFKCEFCDYSSVNKGQVKQHQASKHGKGKLFKCELCDYSSAQSGHVKRHYVRKHENLS